MFLDVVTGSGKDTVLVYVGVYVCVVLTHSHYGDEMHVPIT